MVYILPCLAVTWLVPHKAAVILAHSMYIVQPCTMSYHMQSHIHRVHVCLAVTFHLHFWQNDRDRLHAPVVKWGVEWILKSESAQKVDPGEENSPAGIQTCNLSIMNLVGGMSSIFFHDALRPQKHKLNY